MADLKQFLEEASVEFLMLGGANDRLEERQAQAIELEASNTKMKELTEEKLKLEKLRPWEVGLKRLS